MRKIKYLIIILCVVILITGCGKQVEEVDESLVTINGLEFHFDKDATYEMLNYKIISDFKSSSMNNYIQYSYHQEDGTNLLFFRIFYYSGKGIDYARKDLGIDDSLKLYDGNTKNIKYKIIDGKRDDGTIHFYFINKDDNLYVVNFVSKYDIREFESKVLESLKF